MKTESSLSWIRKSIYSALIFFGTLIVLSVGYAAYQAITSIEYAPWATLTSSLMTKIVGNVDDLNTRMNGITTSTGQIRPEVLPFKKGQIVGSGSVSLNDATTNSTTSYYHVEQLQANRNLISSGVHWGIDNSEIGTMSIGGNVTGTNGSPSVSIPTGYYAGKTATVSDTNLVAGNIKSGVSVFWVSGSYVGTTYFTTTTYATCPSWTWNAACIAAGWVVANFPFSSCGVWQATIWNWATWSATNIWCTNASVCGNMGSPVTVLCSR